MKKIVCSSLILVLLVLVTTLCGCNLLLHTHTYSEWTITKQATCTQDGLKERVCECGEKENGTISATGHTEGEWIIDNEPNCTQDGSKHQVCAICGTTIKNESIEATGHAFGNWITDVDFTCTQDGSKHRVCSNCGEEQTEVIPAGHDYSNKICINCGDVLYSEGLEYVISEDYSYYIVSGIGSCSDTSIAIPSVYKGKPVKSIKAYAFNDEDTLKSVVIPNSITDISHYAFYGCSKLNTVIFEDGSKCASIGDGAFYHCALTSINLANCSHLESIGEEAFRHCDFTNIVIPEGVTSIGQYAFGYCYLLTTVTIPSTVTSIGSRAFYNCSSLDKVEISDLAAWCNIDFSESETNPLSYAKKLYLNGSEVTELDIPEGVISISPYAFYNCNNITSVTIPSSVNQIGKWAFRNCTKLADVTFIDGNLTYIGQGSFGGCTRLTSITIPSSVTFIYQGAFHGCTNLTSITLEDTTEWYRDAAGIPYGALVDVTDPIKNAQNLTNSNAYPYTWRKR